MKKAAFIYNPYSGGRKVPLELDYVLGCFQEHDVLMQPYRITSGENERLIDILRNDNYSYVVVSGGDGTLNSMVNLLLKNEIHLPVGVIPSGTCNDFARSLGLPTSLSDCLDVILSGKVIGVDVGLVNEEQYFLSTCAGGSFVGVSFNTHSELKKNFGPFAYYLKGISEVGNVKSFKLKITTDTEVIEGKLILFLILNGGGAGGFTNIAKEADITDGMMDIVLIKNCSHIDLASLFFKVLSNDSLKNKNVIMLRSKTCTIEGRKGVDISIDGEKGSELPLTVRFIHKALEVFVK